MKLTSHLLNDVTKILSYYDCLIRSFFISFGGFNTYFDTSELRLRQIVLERKNKVGRLTITDSTKSPNLDKIQSFEASIGFSDLQEAYFHPQVYADGMVISRNLVNM